MSWIEDILSDYRDWLQKEPTILCDSSTGWFVVPTPFIGLFNDLMEVFVMEKGDDIILSDDGATLWNAESAGFDANNLENKTLIETILTRYDVTLNGEKHMVKQVTKEQFNQGKYGLSMAMLAINDIASKNSSIFQRNVKIHMLSQAVNAFPQIQIRGRSGIDFTFDYIVSRPKIEYIIQSVSNLDMNVLASFIFGFEDVSDFRRLASEKDVKGMIIINDVDKAVNQNYLKALRSRNMDYVLWSSRKDSPVWQTICSAI